MLSHSWAGLTNKKTRNRNTQIRRVQQLVWGNSFIHIWFPLLNKVEHLSRSVLLRDHTLFSANYPDPSGQNFGDGSGIMNHESWIIVTKNVRIMNLCFKNLGIRNPCTSAQESWITRLWEKLNIWILRSIQGIQDMAFPRVQFSNIFRGEYASGPPYIIRAFGAASPLVSPVTLVLNVQFHTWTKRLIIPSLD